MRAGAVALVVALAVGCGDDAPQRQAADPAVAEPRRQRVRLAWPEDDETDEERLARIRAEEGIRTVTPEEQAAAEAAWLKARAEREKRRRVRRWAWESPAETRAKTWNVPATESEEATLTAFLRICIAEADGAGQDCVGIWQVLRNIRRRTCERGMVRRITECEEDGGETMLSVMRRAQPHILAVRGYRLRNARAGWIRNLTTDCEMPEGWRHGENRWDAAYGTKVCPQTVALGRALMAGEQLPSAPGRRLRWLPGRPITWGGRCESGRGACDDRIACARGLARVRGPDTLNAFWCRPGSASCAPTLDPICTQLGYGPRPDATPDDEAGSGASGVDAPTGSGQVLTGKAPQPRPVLDQSQPVG